MTTPPSSYGGTCGYKSPCHPRRLPVMPPLFRRRSLQLPSLVAPHVWPPAARTHLMAAKGRSLPEMLMLHALAYLFYTRLHPHAEHAQSGVLSSVHRHAHAPLSCGVLCHAQPTHSQRCSFHGTLAHPCRRSKLPFTPVTTLLPSQFPHPCLCLAASLRGQLRPCSTSFHAHALR